MSEIAKFMDNKLKSNLDKIDKPIEQILVEFVQHPGFDLFYRQILASKINMFTDHLLNEQEDELKTMTVNKANRILRNILIDLYNEAELKSRELAVIQYNE